MIDLIGAIRKILSKTDLIPAVPAIKPTYETISYAPGLVTSGDLIVGTKTITAIAEASGTGNADYSSALTLPMTCTVNGVSKVIGSTETRLAIIRIGTRSSITIDSDDGTHDLRCRIYVDAQDANHLLQDLTFTTTGNQLNVQDCLVGTKEVIFNLLKDGSAHTFYFFFWSPGNHSPVISVAQVWEAWSVTNATSWKMVGLLTHTGDMEVEVYMSRVGSATTPTMTFTRSDFVVAGNNIGVGSANTAVRIREYVKDSTNIGFYNNTSTDLTYIGACNILLRSDI